ncbi:hypothetical protein GCM10023228_11620 [Brevibacillus fulvus]
MIRALSHLAKYAIVDNCQTGFPDVRKHGKLEASCVLRQKGRVKNAFNEFDYDRRDWFDQFYF